MLFRGNFRETVELSYEYETRDQKGVSETRRQLSTVGAFVSLMCLRLEKWCAGQCVVILKSVHCKNVIARLPHADLPSILSGERLGIIDPHQKFFNQSTFGCNMRKNPGLVDSLSHQFEPYIGVFGVNKDVLRRGQFRHTLFRSVKPYCGQREKCTPLLALQARFDQKRLVHFEMLKTKLTKRDERCSPVPILTGDLSAKQTGSLFARVCDIETVRVLFRFPLRVEASPLSDTIYTPQKALLLYSCFMKDAHHMLTFLKVCH